MKTKLAILILLLSSCKEQRKTLLQNNGASMEIYFIDDKTLILRPSQITEGQFWASKNLDSVKITESVDEYIHHFDSLRGEKSYEVDQIDMFDHHFAIVFKAETAIDTMYVDGKLELFKWKSKQNYFVDPDNYFKPKLQVIYTRKK